jgi:asparagine synthase (glutamine-hydrolysing)
MCGIAGVVDLQGRGRVPSPDVVDAMTDALAHRGPDGRGTWRNRDAALGHRRLAILDPTPAAAQPFVGRSGRSDVALTFNGEIYNFKALRAELEAKGHAFVTTGDTEVLLAAWIEWGPRCVEKLNGIFAFAIVDGKRVFLARDHIGIKPLFYAVHDGVLRFGSELKAILADRSVARAPDLAALDCFLTHAYVPAPLSPFAGLVQLEPASTLSAVIGEPSSLVVARYWRPTVGERDVSYDDALAELRTRLHASVEAQMVSDVPLGAFLSGGLDSASVVAEMVALTSRQAVRTFSIGFAQASFDERAGAAHTARVLGAEHRADVIDLDLDRTVVDVASTNDDLLADPSLLAVDHLCRMTRREVTVALSGDGADEIFAGYPTYAATYAARGWRMVPSPLRHLAKRGVQRALPPSTERYSPRDFALRFLGGAEKGAGRDFASWRRYFDDDDRRVLVRPAAVRDGAALDRYARTLDEAGPRATMLKRMLVADLLFYLPNDMLVKVDRASMRHGLEVRVPFLDPTFVDFALSLPSRFLLSPRGETKRILRSHVEKTVSRATARRKKRGFSVPVGTALKGAMGDTLLDAVRSRAFASDGPLDVAAVEQRLRAHRAGEVDATYPLYAVLVLALWWRNFLS